jgi:hypothetical protein
LNEGDIDHVILQPTGDAQTTSTTSGPGLVPAHATTTHSNPVPVLLAPQPVIQGIRKSTCIRHPLEALIRSQASERDIDEAAGLGNEWATDDTAMSAYIRSMVFVTTAPTSLPDPGNYLLSRHVPATTNPKVCLLTSTVLGQLCSSALGHATQW